MGEKKIKTCGVKDDGHSVVGQWFTPFGRARVFWFVWHSTIYVVTGVYSIIFCSLAWLPWQNKQHERRERCTEYVQERKRQIIHDDASPCNPPVAHGHQVVRHTTLHDQTMPRQILFTFSFNDARHFNVNHMLMVCRWWGLSSTSFWSTFFSHISLSGFFSAAVQPGWSRLHPVSQPVRPSQFTTMTTRIFANNENWITFFNRPSWDSCCCYLRAVWIGIATLLTCLALSERTDDQVECWRPSGLPLCDASLFTE